VFTKKEANSFLL